MEINGRTIGFRRTVYANCKMSDASPNGNIGNLIEQLIDKENYARSQRAAAIMITALNEGYETHKHVVDPDYAPNPIKAEELMSLDDAEFSALFDEAFAVFRGDAKTTVEVEPPKAGKKKAQGGKSD